MPYRFLLLGLASAALVACGTPQPKPPQAIAKLQAISGSKVRGDVKFTQAEQKVTVSAVIYGLKPNSEHGFHIHEKGDCAENGNAAGGHFNPLGNNHGKYDGPQHHMGDLPSLMADANGVATVNVESPDISLLEGQGNIIGRTVIVHAQADDFVTQPTGNSGARIGCAVTTGN